jgi:hypothetical protein
MGSRQLLVLGLALTVLACEEPTPPPVDPVLISVLHGPVTASTGPMDAGVLVTVGVSVRIENRSEYEISVSRCEAQLYRSGSTLTLVAAQSCVTTPSRIVLAPGESAVQAYQVRGCAEGTCLVPSWTGAISGRYKFVVGVDVGVPGLDPMNTFAMSPSFDVQHVVPVHD